VVAGYTAGKKSGVLAGADQGQAEIYAGCYNAAFVNGAQSTTTGAIGGGIVLGYKDGYESVISGFTTDGYGYRPSSPSVENGIGGLGDGFADGYGDGRSVSCNVATTPSRYGYGSSQAVSSGNLLDWAYFDSYSNQVSEDFTYHYSVYMTESQADKMDATLAATRADEKSFLRDTR